MGSLLVVGNIQFTALIIHRRFVINQHYPQLRSPVVYFNVSQINMLRQLTPCAVMQNTRFETCLRWSVLLSRCRKMQLTAFDIFPPDVDECADPSNSPCHSNAVCDNTVGSYLCTCL